MVALRPTAMFVVFGENEEVWRQRPGRATDGERFRCGSAAVPLQRICGAFPKGTRDTWATAGFT